MVEKKVASHLNDITQLIDFLKPEERVFIQLHNFPDMDAISSAFGLQHLLGLYGIRTTLIYEGELVRNAFVKMIDDLGINLRRAETCSMDSSDKIIIVDGCKGNKNVRDLVGDEVAIIDHHQVESPEDVEFADIRNDYGACATIIASYYHQLSIEIPQEVATCFMVGINTDTLHLTRSFSRFDREVYFSLYDIADISYLNRIIRNYIQQEDLKYYRILIEKLKIYKRSAFCYMEEGCDKNLLGILSDYTLSLDSVDFVTLCANNGSVINFSLRNEEEQWNASLIIQEVLEGIGFAGGHAEMAGGIVRDPERFNAEIISAKIQEKLYP
jgi:nanoRNase/pAp phosphatase (c-di-AMP/oligoRNAs hydrolase)